MAAFCVKPANSPCSITPKSCARRRRRLPRCAPEQDGRHEPATAPPDARVILGLTPQLRVDGVQVDASAPLCISPIRSTDDRHQLLDLPTLIGLVTGGDRMIHAMTDVIAKYLLLEPPQSCAHRRNLRD